MVTKVSYVATMEIVQQGIVCGQMQSMQLLLLLYHAATITTSLASVKQQRATLTLGFATRSVKGISTETGEYNKLSGADSANPISQQLLCALQRS